MAIIIGSLFIGFLTQWNYGALFEGVKNLLVPEKKTEPGSTLQQLSVPAFASFAFDCLKSCEFGEIEKDCGSVYVQASKDYADLSPGEIQNLWGKLNLCSDCNNLNMKPYGLPRVLNVECKDGSLVIQ